MFSFADRYKNGYQTGKCPLTNSLLNSNNSTWVNAFMVHFKK